MVTAALSIAELRNFLSQGFGELEFENTFVCSCILTAAVSIAEIHQVVLAQTEKMRVECALAGTCGCSSQGHRHELLSPTHHGRAGSR